MVDFDLVVDIVILVFIFKQKRASLKAELGQSNLPLWSTNQRREDAKKWLRLVKKKNFFSNNIQKETDNELDQSNLAGEADDQSASR